MIRLAKITDLHLITPLFRELDAKHIGSNKDVKRVILNKRYKSLFKNVFKKNSSYILIVNVFEKEIVGFALGKLLKVENSLIFKNQIIGEILYLAIQESYKRKGLGKKMINEIEKRLKDNGAEKIELRVYSFNKEAIPQKNNYKEKYTTYEKYL
tara:strand:- start:241 stop:702 length:462 start_codon:yes stop_codon:yes gene_type:complete